MKIRNILLVTGAALIGGLVSIGVYKLVEPTSPPVTFEERQQAYFRNVSVDDVPDRVQDFTYAAEATTPAVVHIKSRYMAQQRGTYRGHDPFREFFEDHFRHRFQEPHGRQPRQQSGSGVILSPDGYIVTNNHVISKADEIEVVMHDRRTYQAEVIGTDPSTDLALLKIEEEELPFVRFGNSDELRVGEWVLAVGNPFNLSSTVTAGIVSAKARNINILKDRWAIESFIQTDAAVNPGNSGGALVNLKGELVGINTAIATPTGVYAGYAFAVPVNMVKKVVDDLLEHGVVQRAFLGVVIRDMNGNLADHLGMDRYEGVYVDSVMPGSAAQAGGLQSGDLIIAVEEQEVTNTAHLQEHIARYRPGDKVHLTVIRDRSEKEIEVELRNKEGSTDLVVKAPEEEVPEVLGAEFRELDADELRKYGLRGGVQVIKLHEGKLKKYTQIREGFIITKVDNEPVRTLEDLIGVVEQKQRQRGDSGILVEGVYPQARGVYYYGFRL